MRKEKVYILLEQFQSEDEEERKQKITKIMNEIIQKYIEKESEN